MLSIIRNETGLATMAVLAIIAVVSLTGIALVGMMNTDITHATVQGAVSRAHFIAQGGIQQAIVQLKADPLHRTVPYPQSLPSVPFGDGDFTAWVEDYPAEDTVQITSRGRAYYGSREVPSVIRVIARVGPPLPFGLFGVSTVAAQGANARTYLAPWRPAGPGVPRGANMGSFLDINFQDTGSRLNAVSENSEYSVTLRDGTFRDWELYGFSSRPAYDPSEPEPWILAAFGDLVKAQPEGDPSPHPCVPPSTYACLTVQNSPRDVQTIRELRDDENMGHVYMSRVRRRVLPRVTLEQALLKSAAANNAANAAINAAAGVGHGDAVYTAAEFSRVLAYLRSNPGAELAGALYVQGSVRLDDDLEIEDGTLAVEGDLTLGNNVSLTVRHDILNPDPDRAGEARKKAAVALFPGGGGTGRLFMSGGASQKLTADGLLYTSDGMEVDPQATVDLIGAMYHGSADGRRPSFDNRNAGVIIRFDPLATSMLSPPSPGVGLDVISWQQIR